MPFGSAREGVFERTTNLFTQIGHFTRRMHNKAMIADNQLAIVGGRNLGDEYFSASEQYCSSATSTCSPPVRSPPMSPASFDDYWNSSLAYPLRVLNKQKFDAKELDQTRDDLRQHWRTNADPIQRKAAERNAAPPRRFPAGNSA